MKKPHSPGLGQKKLQPNNPQGPRVGAGVGLYDGKADGAFEGDDVTGAEVTGADVTGAEVTGADVTGAEVTGADVTGAEVTGAEVTGAFVAESTMILS